MKKYPTEIYEHARPIPTIDQSVLNDRGLEVIEGLDVALADQLVELSKESHVDKYCVNEPARFGNSDRVKQWLRKGRLALPLITMEGREMMGFGWMGPGLPGPDEPEIPGAEITFAIRLYSRATGQRLASPYTNAILAAHDFMFGNRGVWLESWGDNSSALGTYDRAGFTRVAEIEGERRGEKVTRIYMTLGKLTATT